MKSTRAHYRIKVKIHASQKIIITCYISICESFFFDHHSEFPTIIDITISITSNTLIPGITATLQPKDHQSSCSPITVEFPPNKPPMNVYNTKCPPVLCVRTLLVGPTSIKQRVLLGLTAEACFAVDGVSCHLIFFCQSRRSVKHSEHPPSILPNDAE